MDIVKFRGMAAALLALTSLSVSAQTSTARQPGQPELPSRPVAAAPQSLSNPALKLSDAQKAQIEKIIAAYAAEQQALRKQHPAAPSVEATAARTMPSEAAVRQRIAAGQTREPEAVTAARQSRARMEAAVDQVLNENQRRMLKDAQAARSAAPPMTRPAAQPTR